MKLTEKITQKLKEKAVNIMGDWFTENESKGLYRGERFDQSWSYRPMLNSVKYDIELYIETSINKQQEKGSSKAILVVRSNTGTAKFINKELDYKFVNSSNWEYTEDELKVIFKKAEKEMMSKLKDFNSEYDDTIEIKEEAKSDDKNNDELFSKWQTLINMSKSELEKYIDSGTGKKSGMSRKEAEGSIKRGRDSARAIVRMLGTKKEDWTDNDWDWAKRQVSFISRMSKNKGKLYDEKDRPTRKLMSLLIWGHKPKGFKGFGSLKVSESQYN